MKHIKKVVTLFLAFAMVLAMSAVSFAAADTGSHTITLDSDDTHTYKVFQVLTGTHAAEGDQNLGNPKWGADATAEAKEGSESAFIQNLQGKTEEQVAALVAAQVDTTATGRGTVSPGHPISNLATGYYVLVDVTTLAKYGENPEKIDTKALNVVKVVNDINSLDIKWGTTEDKKEITGDTLGNATAASPRNPDASDKDNVSIGDTVNFKITAKIPANADNYNYFYFVINDTLDTGLTLNADSIKVYKSSISDANKLTEGAENDYQVKTGAAAAQKAFQVALNNAKSLPGETIIVTYSAVLNENATIGEVPNTNKSTVTYSNDPNHDYDGQNNPGFPAQSDKDALGETPESKTETFTTGIEIQKVDQDGNVLTGAEFTITGPSTEIVLVSSETFAEAEGGDYYGLKNGTYTKEAPITADYMEEAEAGATAGYVVAEDGYDGEDKVVVGGTTYRPYKTGDTGKVYVLVKANSDQYDGKRYSKTVTYTQKDTTGTGAVDAKAEVGADGVVRFVGLGAGTYTIKETKTPAGYNTLPDMSVDISFTASPTGQNPHWSTTSTDAKYNKTTGVFEITIENQQGTELPSTGGIGTVIFYVLGSLLVVGCGIVLISKRRMKSTK